MNIKKSQSDIYSEFIEEYLQKYHHGNKNEEIESLKILHMELWNPIYEKLITDRILLYKGELEIEYMIPCSCIYCDKYGGDCSTCPFEEVLGNNCNIVGSWYDFYDMCTDEYFSIEVIKKEDDYEKLKDAVWNILTVPEHHNED